MNFYKWKNKESCKAMHIKHSGILGYIMSTSYRKAGKSVLYALNHSDCVLRFWLFKDKDFFSFQEYIACLTVVYVLGHIKRWKINDYSKSLEGNKIIR